jgi:undecaprenyl-diphosphatase
MMEELLSCERSLFLWLNGTHTPFLDTLLWPFSGLLVWCPPLLVTAYFYWRRRNRWLSATLATGIVLACCGAVSAFLFKPCFARLRPTVHPLFMDCVTLLRDYRADGPYGFISGHATSAFGFAVLSLLQMKNRYYTVAVLTWAFLMGYSRIYMGVHFVSDVIAGMGVGSLLGWGVYRLYTCASKRYFHTNPFNNTFR